MERLRKISISNMRPRLRRASHSTLRTDNDSSNPRKLKKRPPPPPVPPLPANILSFNIQCDAIEFLNLEPEPWMNVSFTRKEADFGLLPPDFRSTQCESLMSVESIYCDWETRGMGSNPGLAYDRSSSSASSSLPTEDGTYGNDINHFQQPLSRHLRTLSTQEGHNGATVQFPTATDYDVSLRHSAMMYQKPSQFYHHRRTYSQSNLSQVGDHRTKQPHPALPLLSRRLALASTSSLNRHSQEGHLQARHSAYRPTSSRLIANDDGLCQHV